jgi:spore germination cell wall hydrolase CwlJ-like protein
MTQSVPCERSLPEDRVATLDMLESFAQGDAQCLTEALYLKRGERLKVSTPAEVIPEPHDHAGYLATLCGVISQGTGRQFACQFTYTCDGLGSG